MDMADSVDVSLRLCYDNDTLLFSKVKDSPMKDKIPYPKMITACLEVKVSYCEVHRSTRVDDVFTVHEVGVVTRVVWRAQVTII